MLIDVAFASCLANRMSRTDWTRMAAASSVENYSKLPKSYCVTALIVVRHNVPVAAPLVLRSAEAARPAGRLRPTLVGLRAQAFPKRRQASDGESASTLFHHNESR